MIACAIFGDEAIFFFWVVGLPVFSDFLPGLLFLFLLLQSLCQFGEISSQFYFYT